MKYFLRQFLKVTSLLTFGCNVFFSTEAYCLALGESNNGTIKFDNFQGLVSRLPLTDVFIKTYTILQNEPGAKKSDHSAFLKEVEFSDLEDYQLIAKDYSAFRGALKMAASSGSGDKIEKLEILAKRFHSSLSNLVKLPGKIADMEKNYSMFSKNLKVDLVTSKRGVIIASTEFYMDVDIYANIALEFSLQDQLPQPFEGLLSHFRNWLRNPVDVTKTFKKIKPIKIAETWDNAHKACNSAILRFNSGGNYANDLDTENNKGYYFLAVIPDLLNDKPSIELSYFLADVQTCRKNNYWTF